MGAEGYITGSIAADRVVRLIAAHVEAAPPAVREQIRDGHQSLFFGLQYLAGRSDLPTGEVVQALSRLDEHGYLSIGYRNHGVDVFMLARAIAA